MRAAVAAAFALALTLSPRAHAQDDEDVTRRVRLRGASVHEAARLLAAAHDAGAWVVAPTGASIDLDVDGAAEESFEALARAAGLAVRRHDQRARAVFWIAEEHRLLRAESASVRGLSGGRRLDLDHDSVEAAELVGTLAARSRVSVRGAPIGAITVHMREARSSRAIEVLARLANARVSRRGREVAMSLGALPPVPRRPRPSCEAADRASVALGCVAVDQLTLVGLASDVALVRGPDGRSVILRAGDRVGAGAWRVAAFEDGALILADGEGEDAARRPLPLPGA